MTPSDKQNELEYLKELVIHMMKADSRRGAINTEPIALEGKVLMLYNYAKIWKPLSVYKLRRGMTRGLYFS